MAVIESSTVLRTSEVTQIPGGDVFGTGFPATIAHIGSATPSWNTVVGLKPIGTADFGTNSRHVNGFVVDEASKNGPLVLKELAAGIVMSVMYGRHVGQVVPVWLLSVVPTQL